MEKTSGYLAADRYSVVYMLQKYTQEQNILKGIKRQKQNTYKVL
jgi:hypothetical protein